MSASFSNVPNAEKKLAYYSAWLHQLQDCTNYHGAITELATYVALKRGKPMLNIRPRISKIVKGQVQSSAEHLLIIQEWMNTKNTRTTKT